MDTHGHTDMHRHAQTRVSRARPAHRALGSVLFFRLLPEATGPSARCAASCAGIRAPVLAALHLQRAYLCFMTRC